MQDIYYVTQIILSVIVSITVMYYLISKMTEKRRRTIERLESRLEDFEENQEYFTDRLNQYNNDLVAMKGNKEVNKETNL